MYENQFIQFTQAIDPLDSCMPLPVVFGGDGIAFFVPTDNKDAEFTLVDAEGNPFTQNGSTLTNKFRSLAGNYAAKAFGDDIPRLLPRLQNRIFKASDARNYVAPNECFRIKIYDDEEDVEYYSNLLRRYENPNGEFALLSYTCDSETFDLPFTTERPVRQWLPIWLNKPKYNQKDEIYEKLSGERVVLFATINKELNAQTDYIPESWHERIVLALSCDDVRVNGVKLTKSDNYDIDWDNHTENHCGVWLARATWKMAANVTSRNSNN